MGSFDGNIALVVGATALYTASKHAVIGLTKTAALENARFGIRVNAMCPSAINGEMLRGFMANRGISGEQMETYVPIGRIGKPEDVAEAVLGSVLKANDE